MVNCKIKLLLAGKSRWPRYLNVKVEGLCEWRAWGCCEVFRPECLASQKAAEGKASVSRASPCFLPLTLTETQQVYMHCREFGSSFSFSYSVAFSWVPGLFCETMKCLVVKAKPLNNSVAARMAEECLKRCSIPLSGWGACGNSPGTTDCRTFGGLTETASGLLTFFFRFGSFHSFIVKWIFYVHMSCPWSSPSDSLDCLHGSSFCTHNSMPLLGFSVCRRQFLNASGGEMCVKGGLINQHDSRAVSQACSQSRKLGTNGTHNLIFVYFLSKVGNFSLLLYLWIM